MMKYGLLCLTVFLVGCAALGSKTTIHNNARVKEIRTVGLITKRFNQPRNSYHELIKARFTRDLMERLNQKNLFNVVVLDTMENEGLDIKSYKTDAQIDAFLVAEWKLSHPQSVVSDAKVQLSLVDNETKELLIVSSHGTKFGNSYWWTPALPKTLLDATEGSLNALEKNLKSMR